MRPWRLPLSHTLVTADALAQALADLPGWNAGAGKIEKTFVFANFVAAFGWMTKVALVAERLGHHPEWSNVYRTVHVALQTHDVVPAQVTATDLALARAMEALLGGAG